MPEVAQKCGCDWDPEFHRDLNVRRGKAERGARCTNPVYADAFGGDSGICVACLFGCPPDDDEPPARPDAAVAAGGEGGE